MKNKLKIVTVIALITILVSLVSNGVVVAQPPIKIGIIDPMMTIQGRSAKWGAQIAADDLGGKILGRDIELVYADSYQGGIEFSPGAGTTAGNELIAAGVDFVLGGFRSEAVTEYLPIFMANHLPYIITGAATDQFLVNVLTDYPNYKYLFRNMPPNSTTLVYTLATYFGYYLLPIMTTLFGEDFGGASNQTGYTVVYENLLWTTTMRPVVMPTLLGDPLAHFVGPWTGDPQTSGYPIDVVTLPDFNAICADIKSRHARLVVHIFSQIVAGAAFITAMKDNEVPAVCVGINVASQEFGMWTGTGGAATYPYWPTAGCEYETFLAPAGTRTPINEITTYFWDKYVSWPPNTGGEEPIYTGIGTYGALLLLADAIERAGTTDTNTVITKLEETTAFPTGMGLFQFTDGPGGPGQGHDVYMTPYDVTPYWPPPQWSRNFIVQWQAGRRELVNPQTYGPGAPPLPYAKQYALPPWMWTNEPDVTWDGKCDMRDTSLASKAFGTVPGHPRWQFSCDVNPSYDAGRDRKVDGRDSTFISRYFGTFYEIPVPYPS